MAMEIIDFFIKHGKFHDPLHTFIRPKLFNPYSAKLGNLHFQPLEAVSRYSDPRLQEAGNICKS